ncbi:MAG: GNAT family N-acetyltransferase [Armatimonadetes bacterium]|nr:GNAT family N-acetyltransferase [Armatimonadota bacterium]
MDTRLQNVTFRPLAAASDYDSAARLRNLHFFQRPISGDQLEESIGYHPLSVRARRTLMSIDGADVAYASTVENYWMKSESRFELFCTATDAESWHRLLDRHMTMAVEDGARKLSTWQRSDQPEKLALLTEDGFVETQRNPESSVDVEAFDPAPYAKLMHDVRRRYDIVDYAAYAKTDPEGWLHEAWRIEMDVMSDVPLPEPFEETPFESWRKETQSPSVDQHALFIALLDGTPAGISQLLPNKIDPSVCSTGLTGVRRDHRRQGLATALKVTGLTWAQGQGIKSVWTDNEDSNPMYALNQGLGFIKRFEWVCLEKDVG